MTTNGRVSHQFNISSNWNVEKRRRELFPQVTDGEWNDWRWQLRNAATSLETVMEYGKFQESERAVLTRVIEKYPVIIVPYYLCLIDFTDPEDPIRIQSFPTRDEIEFADAVSYTHLTLPTKRIV